MDFLTFFDFWGLAKIFIFSGSGSAGSGSVSGSAGSGSKNVRFPVPGSVRKLPEIYENLGRLKKHGNPNNYFESRDFSDDPMTDD